MWEVAGGGVLGRAVWAGLVPPLPLEPTAIHFGSQTECSVFVSSLVEVSVLVTHDWNPTGCAEPPPSECAAVQVVSQWRIAAAAASQEPALVNSSRGTRPGPPIDMQLKVSLGDYKEIQCTHFFSHIFILYFSGKKNKWPLYNQIN